MSLRTRLIAISVGLVLAALIVADAAAYSSLRSSLLDQANRDLAAASSTVAKIWTQGLTGETALAALKNGRAAEAAYVVFDPSGLETGSLPASRFGKGEVLPPGLSRDDLPISPVTLAGEVVKSVIVAGSGKTPDYLVSAFQAKDGAVIAVALPLDTLSATLGSLVQAEELATGAVLIVMVFAAAGLIAVGLRPLAGIERTAAAISGGDLERRVTPANGRTEVGRLGLALNAMLDRIEAAFAAERTADARLRQLVTDAAHELRTPLTSLRGYAELFRRGALSDQEQLAASMRGIEEESERLARLVDDLLLLARLDEAQPLATEVVDLAAVAREAVDAARVVEPDRPIALAAPAQALVRGDRDRLREVADNLLANVRVHTPRGTPAEVVVTEESGTVALSVSDHGPGLSEAVRPHVFERFYRADPARSRDQGGSGLGLAIVAAIAAAHGGTARVAAGNGLGATFRVELQAVPATGQKGEVRAPATVRAFVSDDAPSRDS